MSCGVVCDAHFLGVLVFGGVVVSLVVVWCSWSCRSIFRVLGSVVSVFGCCWVLWCLWVSFWVCVRSVGVGCGLVWVWWSCVVLCSFWVSVGVCLCLGVLLWVSFCVGGGVLLVL